ncbi:MAG: glycosyltransferase family 39 protein [Planctomycetota bacterium]
MPPEPPDAPRPQARDVTLWIALLLSLGSLVWRASSLDAYWLNPDEGLYHEIVTNPSTDVVRRTIRLHPHPPLFYWSLWSLSPSPDGSDIALLRWPALALSTLAILLAYVLGRQLRDGWAGLALAGLVAISPAVHEQSLVIRQYGWVLPFLLGCATATLAAARRGSWGWLFLAGCSLSIGLMLHYSAVLVGLVLLGTYLVLWLRPGSPIRFRLSWLLALLPVIAAGTWVWESNLRVLLLDSEFRGKAATSWLEDEFIDDGGELIRTTLGFFSYAFGRERLLFVMIAFVAGGVIAWRRRSFTGLGLVAAVLAGSWIFSILEIYPFGATRHSSVLIPFLAIPIALLIRDALGRSWRVAGASLGLAAVLFFASSPLGAAIGWDDRSPWLKTVPEQAISREAIEAMREPIDGLALRSATIFLDQQAFAVLHPLIPASARESSEFFGSTIRQIHWQTSDVIVAPCWILTVLDKSADQSRDNELELELVLREVAEERPELGLGSSGAPVFVIAAGWYQPWMFGFSRLKKAASDRAVAISGVRNHRSPGGGIGIFRIDFPAWQSGRAILTAPTGD